MEHEAQDNLWGCFVIMDRAKHILGRAAPMKLWDELWCSVIGDDLSVLDRLAYIDWLCDQIGG